MFCEMEPPISASIIRVSSNRWLLGSSIACQKIDNPKLHPANAVAQWQDGSSTFFLHERSKNETLLKGDAETDRVHVGGTSGAVWLLGNNAFCKAHAWCEGLENWKLVIYGLELDRTFVITKRVGGQTLERAWPQMSSSIRVQIANEVAGYCATLAANKSSRFETVTGHGVHEPRLMERAPQAHPTWKPRMLGPFSEQEMHDYMTRISNNPAPCIDSEFLFYHADLGPTNIIVSENDDHDDYQVAGIIDWESAAYYPRFWITTKPVTAGAFWLECETEEPKLWGQLLGKALEEKGYEGSESVFRSWSSSIG